MEERDEGDDVVCEAEGDIFAQDGMGEEFSAVAGELHGAGEICLPAFMEGEGNAGGVRHVAGGIEGPE